MTNTILAITQFKGNYWLKWTTGFNEGMVNFSDLYSLKNDISVVLETTKGKYLGDAICHFGSYGDKDGLWEIMIDGFDFSGDSVEGYLTFSEVIRWFNKKIKVEEAKKNDTSEVKTKKKPVKKGLKQGRIF
jgi:hypothetical protein